MPLNHIAELRGFSAYSEEEHMIYTKPELKVIGSVADLTQVGETNPGPDARGGSISPPGHN